MAPVEGWFECIVDEETLEEQVLVLEWSRPRDLKASGRGVVQGTSSSKVLKFVRKFVTEKDLRFL